MRVRNENLGFMPPRSSSWIISIIWLYLALNRTPTIGCYWGGGGSTQGLGLRISSQGSYTVSLHFCLMLNLLKPLT